MSFTVLKADRPDGILAGVTKVNWVKLLVAHHDGTQLIPTGAVVRWWNDEPPAATNAALPNSATPAVDLYAARRPIPL